MQMGFTPEDSAWKSTLRIRRKGSAGEQLGDHLWIKRADILCNRYRGSGKLQADEPQGRQNSDLQECVSFEFMCSFNPAWLIPVRRLLITKLFVSMLYTITVQKSLAGVSVGTFSL